jgi:hypothetical protein
MTSRFLLSFMMHQLQKLLPLPVQILGLAIGNSQTSEIWPFVIKLEMLLTYITAV